MRRNLGNRSSRFSLCLPWGQGSKAVLGCAGAIWSGPGEPGMSHTIHGGPQASVVWPGVSDPGPPHLAVSQPSQVLIPNPLLQPQPCFPSQQLAPPIPFIIHSFSNDRGAVPGTVLGLGIQQRTRRMLISSRISSCVTFIV